MVLIEIAQNKVMVRFLKLNCLCLMLAAGLMFDALGQMSHQLLRFTTHTGLLLT